jgi:hypothetical protein
MRQDRPTGVQTTLSVGSGYAPPQVAFSPDGSHVALLDQPPGDPNTNDARVEIWDLTNPTSPVLQYYLPTIQNMTNPLMLAYTPDGTALAVLRPGAGVDYWDTDPSQVAANLCTAAGDPITPQQWQLYLPGRTYQPPCPGDTE